MYKKPLEDNYPHIYNPVTDSFASIDVHIADSILIEEKMDRNFIASLPDGFYKAIIIQIQTMCMLKTQAKGTQIKTRTELRPPFAYELCAVCPALIDGQGCLRESNKPWLVKSLDIIYISWPHGGNTSDPVAFVVNV